MSDAEARELRVISTALGNVIGLAAMPRKTEQALKAIHVRLGRLALPAPEPTTEISAD